MRLNTIIGIFLVLIARSLSEDAPAPLVVPASQYFEGNDGPWSTFDVRVGTPEQYIRVLVSTASPHTLVPLDGDACSSAVFGTVPPDCAISRGRLYKVNESSSWVDVGLYGINENGVGLAANLGYEARVQFGLEHLGIGLNGPGFENRTVGLIAAPQPFYLGIFGLNGQPVNFTSLGNQSTSSFFTTLKDEKKIPSLSWSYTAGAKYRLKQVYGQLIFSGYDTSRFKENTVSFSMAEDLTRDLVVGLHSISYSGSSSETLLSTPIDIYIDSTDPNIWLPEEACDAFERAFGLTLDTRSGLYLVNETHRNRLLDTNAEVSFRLSDVKPGGETVTIVLPYAAFDLTAKPPLVEQETHYFPLKRANNSGQYTLGRTFLQEAYLTVDYERKVFNVSSCIWNQGASQTIIPITSTNDPNATFGSPSSPSKKLSGGQLAGIIVGSVLGGLLLIAAIAIFLLRKRRKWIGTGFAVAAKKNSSDAARASGGTGGDDPVMGMKGPIFNGVDYSGRHVSGSTPDSSVPFSADDVSGHGSRARSTAEYVRAGGGSRPASAAASDSAAAAAAAGQTVELDGDDTAVRPGAELDGNEVHVLPSVAENPKGVFELPGTAVAGAVGHSGHGAQKGEVRPPSAQSVRLGEREKENHSPPSPMTSTFDGTGNWGLDRNSRADSSLVSPDHPTYRDRPF
ncbi:aspartic peptidase domain-containing protein [Podospora aff. communis PSN243]|uniref:Aspartic peptidase domain-containing protein n=1 Tax=Podospora aff. communis PSN243 TaxID=3040156 RepID=A0AAV9G5T3_9PEZI|nr:aspartic peptidase domain-containing protein [Podospora aff. communis PSN243]